MKSDNPILLRILELKMQKFKTDAEFEKHLALKPKTVDSWKRGLSKAFMDMLPELASLFNVSTDYLTTGKEKLHQQPNALFEQLLTEEEIGLLTSDEKLSNLSREQLESLVNKARVFYKESK